MPDLLAYLLKVNLVLSLTYLTHHFLLSPLTFHNINRLFLLLGILFSTLYPLIDLTVIFQTPEKNATPLLVAMSELKRVGQVTTYTNSFNYWNLLILVYWIGTSMMAIRLIVQSISLYRIHRKSRQQTFNGILYRKIDGDIPPFSFGRAIYMNPDKYGEEELAAILKHEQVHIKELHTIDILLAEIFNLFCWFNPFAWAIKKSIKENLEFITDHKILKGGADPKTYQYSLLKNSTWLKASTLVHNFNFLTIKKRILMMNKEKTKGLHLIKYVLSVPVIVLTAFTASLSQTNPDNATAAPAEEIRYSHIYVFEESQKPMVGKAVSIRLETKKEDPITYYIDGEASDKTHFDQINPDDLEEIHILKGNHAIKIFGNPGSEGVVVLTTKANFNSPKVLAFNERLRDEGYDKPRE